MRRSKFLFCFFLIFFSYGYCLVIKEIDSTSPIKVSFSKKNGNRIAVNGGVVKKIIGLPDICSVCLEKESGQAFIKLLKDLQEPLVFTVITGSGQVQDLEVTFEDKITEVIVLQEMNFEIEEEQLVEKDQNDQAVNIIRTILKGKIPKGFVKNLDWESQRDIYHDRAKIKIIYVLENYDQRIWIAEVKNRTKQSIRLYEKLLKKPGDTWVYLDKNKLNPKEMTQIIISEKKIYE